MEAEACEERPITHDKGVKVGDRVIITSGDGAGFAATVEAISILDRNWGRYAWERYWHTVSLTVSTGIVHRSLTFDSYVLLPK